jgi:lysylphosphatidylglycerol synthetase-like protein (DUF2156 family)
MPRQTYALDPNGPERLEISGGLFWRNTTIRLDGNIIGIIPGQEELAAGQEFHLPDGSALKVQRVITLLTTELQVLRNGQLLPNSVSTLKGKLKFTYGIIFLVAGLDIVGGLASLIFKSEYFVQQGFSFFSIIFGLALLVLGFFVRSQSEMAIIIAISIFILDGVLSSVMVVSQGYIPRCADIFFRILLLLPMIQGIRIIQAIKRLWQ